MEVALPGDADYAPVAAGREDAPQGEDGGWMERLENGREMEAELRQEAKARDLDFERELAQQRQLNNELEGDMIVLCSGLGKYNQEGEFVRTRETLAYIKDIRRLLNFDFKNNVASREIFIRLGTWDVMRGKIIPLLKSYWDDRSLVFELLKVGPPPAARRPTAGDGAAHRRAERHVGAVAAGAAPGDPVPVQGRVLERLGARDADAGGG